MDGKLFVDINILLVDDDATSLAVVSAMLRLCKYQGFSFIFSFFFSCFNLCSLFSYGLKVWSTQF